MAANIEGEQTCHAGITANTEGEQTCHGQEGGPEPTKICSTTGGGMVVQREGHDPCQERWLIICVQGVHPFIHFEKRAGSSRKITALEGIKLRQSKARENGPGPMPRLQNLSQSIRQGPAALEPHEAGPYQGSIDGCAEGNPLLQMHKMRPRSLQSPRIENAPTSMPISRQHIRTRPLFVRTLKVRTRWHG